MQNAEYHKVDNVAVGVADCHAEDRHYGKAQAGQ